MLPEPYYHDEQAGITIYHGRAEDILPTLETADLVLTDPPYGHGDKWAGGTWASNEIYEDAFEWDAQPITPELLDMVIHAGRDAIVWGGNYYSMPPSRCWLSWVKKSLMATLADFELAWTSFDKPAKLYAEHRNPDGKRAHPTQKPVGLMRWCIDFAGSPQSVLDPFMGSGTTLRAAKDIGIPAIGIEKSERYCEIAVRRLQQAVLPLAMG